MRLQTEQEIVHLPLIVLVEGPPQGLVAANVHKPVETEIGERETDGTVTTIMMNEVGDVTEREQTIISTKAGEGTGVGAEVWIGNETRREETDENVIVVVRGDLAPNTPSINDPLRKKGKDQVLLLHHGGNKRTCILADENEDMPLNLVVLTG